MHPSFEICMYNGRPSSKRCSQSTLRPRKSTWNSFTFPSSKILRIGVALSKLMTCLPSFAFRVQRRAVALVRIRVHRPKRLFLPSLCIKVSLTNSPWYIFRVYHIRGDQSSVRRHFHILKKYPGFPYLLERESHRSYTDSLSLEVRTTRG